MTSTTPNPAHVAAAPPAYQLPQRVTQARVLRSEWTKLRTQPSVIWSLLATTILIAGFGIVYSLVRETRRRSACPGSSSRRSRSGCSACCWSPASTPVG